MHMEKFTFLNGIYQEVHEKSAQVKHILSENGYAYAYGFHNNDSIKANGVFVTEYYPIPVFVVSGIGDIGIDIHNTWFEAALPKEKALRFDYTKILGFYDFELYGAIHFLVDLYSPRMRAPDIVKNIENSGDQDFHLLFNFGESLDAKGLLEVISLFAA